MLDAATSSGGLGMRMRRDWLRAAAAALCLAPASVAFAEEATIPPDDEGRGVVHQLPPAKDAFFAANNYTSTTLLHLRSDGTFAEYDREHMFIAVSDEGRWRQVGTGGIELCSHYRFEEVRGGGLTVYVGPNEAAGLPRLAAAIEDRLSATPGTGDLAPRQLMPVVVRWWRSADAYRPPPPGGLAPDVMSERKRVSRKDLRALVAAIREYVGGRRGNLSSFATRRYGDLVWLSHNGSPLGREIVQQYGEHTEGPFLPGTVNVAVNAETFASLLGTRQSFVHYPEMNIRIPRRALLADFRKARVTEPQCAGFEEGAAPLPPLPTATATPVPAGEDIGFVTESVGTKLLVLGSDGRYSRYNRLENETKLTDAGEWSRADDGLVRLCSHSSVFRPIEGDRLNFGIDPVTYSKLSVLLAALRKHLSANPAKVSFGPKEVERIATRALDTKRSGTGDCSCRRLVHGDEPVERKEVQQFVAELGQYLRGGAANLQELRLFSFGSTAWLGEPGGRANPAVIRTLQALGADLCVLPDVLVRVPMPALQELRASMPTNDAVQRPEAPPLCAGFSREAR